MPLLAAGRPVPAEYREDFLVMASLSKGSRSVPFRFDIRCRTAIEKESQSSKLWSVGPITPPNDTRGAKHRPLQRRVGQRRFTRPPPISVRSRKLYSQSRRLRPDWHARNPPVREAQLSRARCEEIRGAQRAKPR